MDKSTFRQDLNKGLIANLDDNNKPLQSSGIVLLSFGGRSYAATLKGN